MKRQVYLSVAFLLVILSMMTPKASALDSWQASPDTTNAGIALTDSILSLGDVLRLVSSGNRTFRSFVQELEAANGSLKQAGLWSNPELDVELEEFGWDAPGFSESEFTLSLAQEFEFFGQRKARKNVAQAGVDITKLQVDLAAFDLYLESKQRFYALAHAQQSSDLTRSSVDLAREVLENITYRYDRGSALQSELLLAQLQVQRAELALDQAEQDVMAIEAELVHLWGGNPSGIRVIGTPEPDPTALTDYITLISDQIDSTRDIMKLQSELKLAEAERDLAVAEAKPAITLSGGFKRFESDNSKSFLLGMSLPIPVFNRNQGERESMDAKARSLEYEVEQSRSAASAAVRSQAIRLNQLIDTHATLDSLLLPTAEDAYRTLQTAYAAGRVPYTQLLEAERSLIDIRFEHNDMLLAIQEQIIALEHITCISLPEDKEN